MKRNLTPKMIIFLGLTKSAVNGVGSIPFIGRFLKHIGSSVAGGVQGLPEAFRVFADDPSRAISALTKYVHRQGPIEVCKF